VRVALLALLACGAVACVSNPGPPDWPELQGQLAQRVAVDQEMRRELMESDLATPEIFERLAAVDRDNTTWMKEVIASHGWPRQDQIGKDGAGNVWLLVQHADHDVEFQEHCLELLARAVAAGQAEPKHQAYLEDRVAMHRGKPQRYGTQFVQAPDGQGFVPHTLADEAHVDELRATVGLPPLAEYAALLNGHAGGGH